MGNCTSTKGTDTAFVSAQRDQKKKDVHVIGVRCGQEHGLRVIESIFEVTMDEGMAHDEVHNCFGKLVAFTAEHPSSTVHILTRSDQTTTTRSTCAGVGTAITGILFPAWHRAYVLAIENALRINDEDTAQVTMLIWDETALDHGGSIYLHKRDLPFW